MVGQIAMGDASEELTPPSTATPSPMPAPKHGSGRPSSQHFRLESVTSLTAPVDSAIAARAAQMRCGRVPQNQVFLSSQGDGGWSSSGASTGGRRWTDNGTTAEEKFPIPDNPTAWARYGFLDTSLLLQATSGKSPGGERATSSGGGAGGAEARRDKDSRRTLVKVEADPGESWRQGNGAGKERSAAGDGGGGRERRHHPPAPTSTTTVSRASEGGRDSSRKIGASTPRTDAVTPSPEDRRRSSGAAEVAAIGGGRSGSSSSRRGDIATGASAPASNRNDDGGPATGRGGGGRRGGLDSMAASMLAASAATAAAAAAKEEEESKEEEREALRRQEERQAAISAAATTALEESNHNGKNRPNARRTQQTIAEVERHKRNRAERLRAYGCQRYGGGGRDGSFILVHATV